MINDDNHFEIELNGVTMKFTRLNLPGHIAFKVEFSSIRKPIVVVRAVDFEASHFWTSVPEGRQREAEGIGKLIEEYFHSKK